MSPGTSQAGRRALLRRLYREYETDVAFSRVRLEAGGVLVPGDGPIDPRLAFVGEAPGAQESKVRKPFVGASGAFLQEMLEHVGLSREEVFITNVVKYRPRRNRDPETAEVHAGIPYLRRELRLLGMPPLVMLGKHARDTLTGELEGWPIGKWFWADWDGGFPVLPLHHPAYGLYQRSNRPKMFEQFRAVLEPPATKEEYLATV